MAYATLGLMLLTCARLLRNTYQLLRGESLLAGIFAFFALIWLVVILSRGANRALPAKALKAGALGLLCGLAGLGLLALALTSYGLVAYGLSAACYAASSLLIAPWARFGADA